MFAFMLLLTMKMSDESFVKDGWSFFVWIRTTSYLILIIYSAYLLRIPSYGRRYCKTSFNRAAGKFCFMHMRRSLYVAKGGATGRGTGKQAHSQV